MGSNIRTYDPKSPMSAGGAAPAPSGPSGPTGGATGPSGPTAPSGPSGPTARGDLGRVAGPRGPKGPGRLNPPPPPAAITDNVVLNVAAKPVGITNTSAVTFVALAAPVTPGLILRYSFGDGKTQNYRINDSVVHIYPGPGKYHVRVTAVKPPVGTKVHGTSLYVTV